MNQNTIKSMQASIKQYREAIKSLQADLKKERQLTKIVREDAKRLRAEKIAAKKAAVAQKRLDREARMEAKVAEQRVRLEARLSALEAKMLKAKSPKALKKASKKASAVTLIPMDSVAA